MRRFFLVGIFVTAVALWAGGTLAAPAKPAKQAKPAKSANKDAVSVPEAWVLAGTLKDLPPGTVKAIPEHKIIVFSDSQGIYAVSSECTHEKCIVGVRKKDAILVCPCHAAKFSFDGAVKSGPAKVGLSCLAVSLEEGGKVFVHLDEVVPAGTRLVPKPDK